MMKDINTAAAALIDGGWTPEDVEQIRGEYDMTEDEAAEIVAEMRRILSTKGPNKMTANEIRNLTGMNRRKFCEAYGIPYATMCDWEAGRVKPAGYVLALLEKVVRADIIEKLNK